jgi:tRNA A37 threonylcarbamoyladenosine dehydratase
MNYVLNNHFVKNKGGITVVGCGGTGGFVAEGLCQMLAPDIKLMLVDFDRVEQRISAARISSGKISARSKARHWPTVSPRNMGVQSVIAPCPSA